MDIDLADVCKDGETALICFSGTVWYVSLRLNMADIRKLSEILEIAYKDLSRLVAEKKPVKKIKMGNPSESR